MTATDPEPAEMPEPTTIEPAPITEADPSPTDIVPPLEHDPDAPITPTDAPQVSAAEVLAVEQAAVDAEASRGEGEPDVAAPPVKRPRKAASKAQAAEPAPAPAESGQPDNKNWYIVKVQSGREETIKSAIERKVRLEGLEEFFGQILVPVEKVSMLVGGKRVVRTRKMYPGYIMAYVEYNDRILYLFRETSGVGDFVGASMNRAPLPMPPREIERMLHTQAPEKVGKGADIAPEKIKIPFEKGDKVRVSDGTFAGMEGEVKEIVEPRDAKEVPRVKVELTIFGRPVPVEVEIWQVQTV